MMATGLNNSTGREGKGRGSGAGSRSRFQIERAFCTCCRSQKMSQREGEAEEAAAMTKAGRADRLTDGWMDAVMTAIVGDKAGLDGRSLFPTSLPRFK